MRWAAGFYQLHRQMLLKEFFLLLPPHNIVVEIQENVPADESVVGACQRLKHRSYSIALDNFAPNDLREWLVPLAGFVN